MSTVVVALGGNAILQPKQRGTAEEQLANVRASCRHIAEMIARGHTVVVTHGNGPQVGNILLQNEEAAGVVPAMPLDVCGAESQGLIGYLIQQSLRNELISHGQLRPVVTVITQVIVDEGDPAFRNPTKPIGPFYTEEKARELAETRGYVMREDSGRGWRRVVPSPDPRDIAEIDAIQTLVAAGAVVIASGGGGVPVVRAGDGTLRGVEAVIDKDLAAQRLAARLGSDVLMILTDVRGVALDYNTPQVRWLDRMTAAEARAYQQQGHFRSGSMGPKVEAALRFVTNGGGKAIIAGLDQALPALEGRAGTLIVSR